MAPGNDSGGLAVTDLPRSGAAMSSSSASSSASRPPTTGAERELAAARLARAVTHALHDELALYPKPGLVSFVDNGSHADMTARTFVRSIVSLRDYFRQIAMLGASAPPFRDLQGLAIAAEQRMLQATAGANTHRGAIFTLGLLCAAAARYRHVTTEPLTAEFLRATLVETWGDALATHARHRDPSNGQRVCRRYGLRGARDEAAAGLPVLFDRAVPALMRAHLAGLDRRHALLQTFFVLMAALDDTNLVHRAGLGGLQFARREAQAFLSAGGAHRPDALVHAEAIHRAFVARRLSPGGSADMLAAASWVVRVCA